jgi:hypothetical protein
MLLCATRKSSATCPIAPPVAEPGLGFESPEACGAKREEGSQPASRSVPCASARSIAAASSATLGTSGSSCGCRRSRSCGQAARAHPQPHSVPPVCPSPDKDRLPADGGSRCCGAPSCKRGVSSTDQSRGKFPSRPRRSPTALSGNCYLAEQARRPSQKTCLGAENRSAKRRGRDSNPRAALRRPPVFKRSPGLPGMHTSKAFMGIAEPPRRSMLRSTPDRGLSGPRN